jgi:peptide chain release factor 1
VNERLDSFLKRYDEVKLLIEDPALIKDQNRYLETMREFSRLTEISESQTEIEKLTAQAAEAKALIQEEDGVMKELAKDELNANETR